MPRPARLSWLLPAAAAAVLLASRVPPDPTAPAAAGIPAPPSQVRGLLDLVSDDPELDRLERLTAQDRHTEAFAQAVDRLTTHAEADGPFAPATLARLQWVAATAAAGGDRDTAEDLFEALLALRRAARPADDLRLAETLLRRGRLARVSDDPALARRFLAEARSLAEHGGAPLLLNASIEQAFGSLGLRSDLGEALAGYRRALAIRRRATGSDFLTADNLTWMAWVLDRLGHEKESERVALQARALLERCGLGGTTLDAALLQLRGDGLAQQGRWEEAAPLYREAAGIYGAARPRHLGGFARRVCPLDGYEPLALAALRRGDGDEAWTLLESGRAALHRDLLLLGRDDAPGAGGAHAALRALRLSLTDRLRDRDRARRSGVTAWSEATWRDTLAILALRARQGTLERAILEADPARAVTLREAQAVLDPRTALIGWLEVDLGGSPSLVSQPRRSWGFGYVIRSSGPVHWAPLWDGRRPPEEESDRDDWGPAFARIRRAASWPLRVAADPELDGGLREWTRRVFDPLQPWLVGVDHLVVEGTRLPVELFRDEQGRGFLDRYTVSYVPSAGVLASIRPPARVAPPRRALSLSAAPMWPDAAPPAVLAQADERRDLRQTRNAFRRDGVPLDDLPRLRFAGFEARAVAERFAGATLLQGDQAEARLRAMAAGSALQDFDVIHLATHTLFDAAPERSGLVLAEHAPAASAEDDGILDAQEILLGWRLHGALVTLSACESGRSAGLWRGEDLGLAPALLASGADRVLVSLWPVDDRATAILMDRFYTELAAGASPDAALRDAKRFVRDLREGDRAPFSHPAYWGGFVLIGPPGR
jgi:tetratricopeptide (TPR) repeat protein